MYTRKISCLVIILLVTTITNLYSMDRPPEENVSDLVGNVLLGVEEPRAFLLFTNLPKDMQDRIIQFASLYSTAETLEIAAHTINSLAQVNTELNQKINNPIFCLQIIKHLAKRFDCTDFDACKALQTHAAKQRLELQLELYTLCRNVEPLDFQGNPVSPQHNDRYLEIVIEAQNPSLTVRQRAPIIRSYYAKRYLPSGCKELPVDYDFEKALNSLRQQNVDLEFTYPFISSYPGRKDEIRYKSGLTPLMIALSIRVRPLGKFGTPYANLSINYKKIPILLISHGANSNGTNNNGDTALMLIAIEGQFDMLEPFFQNSKQPIDINKQNNQGYTALMYAMISYSQLKLSPLNSLKMINYLVRAGANPNIANNEGMTILNYATDIPSTIAPLIPIVLKGELTEELYLKAVEDEARRIPPHALPESIVFGLLPK